MRIAIYNNYSNADVVNHYLSVILSGLKNASYDCREIKSFSEACRNETIVVSNPLDVVKLYIKGYRHFILWMQGITPEESYLKHKSKLRHFVLSKADRFALRHSKFVFLVSQTMKDFLENKYKIEIPNFYIMPCYNDSLNEDMLDIKEKYERNVFAYVGSLSVWQCFEETVCMYKQIEDSLPSSFFKVLTKDKELATELIQKYGIRNWSVDTVKPKDVNSALHDVKFGFVLRNDSCVNNVATPTKISSYMAAGVIPVVTRALRDITLMAKGKCCVVVLNNLNDIDPLIYAATSKIDISNIKKEFKEIFSQYYSDDYHICCISELFKNFHL